MKAFLVKTLRVIVDGVIARTLVIGMSRSRDGNSSPSSDT